MRLLILFVATIGVSTGGLRAERPHSMRYADPVLEPWRLTQFPELEGRGVRCLAEDGSGNMWFGLKNGAVRYDGYEWTDFGTDQGLPGTAVVDLAARSNGGLLAATELGIFQKQADSWSRIFPSDPETRLPVSFVMEASDSSIWACTAWGVVRCRADTTCLFTDRLRAGLAEHLGVFDRVEVLPNHVFPIKKNYFGSNIFLTGHVVVAIGEDGPGRAAGLSVGDRILSVNGHRIDLHDELNASDGKELELEVVRTTTGRREVVQLVASGEEPNTHRDPTGNAVMEDSRGRVWIGFRWGKFAMSDDGGETWNHWSSSDGATKKSRAFPVEAADGDIWIIAAGSNENISRFDGREWTSDRLAMLGGNAYIGSAACTADGSLWVGGLNRLHVRRNGQWATHDTRDLKLPCEGQRLFVASDGALWITGYDQAAVRMGLSPAEFASPECRHFCTEPSGVHWLLDESTQRLVRDGGERVISFGTEDGLIDNPVGVLAVPDFGVVAFGSHRKIAALSTFDGTRWVTKEFPQIAECFSGRGFCVGRDGKVWIAARGRRTESQVGGVVHGLGSDWTHYAPPEAPHFATSVLALPDGRVWFGGGFGVVQFDGKNWSRIRNELLDDASSPSGTIDKSGTVYLGTRTKGVLRYRAGNWTVLGVDAGLPTNEVSAVHCDSNDHLWVATRDGLCRFDGKRFSSVKLPQRIGRDWINSEPDGSVWVSGRFRVSPRNDPVRIHLSRNQISTGTDSKTLLEWRGVDRWNRTPPDQIEWSWRVDDGAWSDYSRTGQTTLENLSAGRHTVEIRARDNDFNVTPQAASISISAQLPLWQRPWFLILTVAVAGIIVWQSGGLIRRGQALKETNRRLHAAQELVSRQYEEKSAQFRAICDCSPVGIFVMDPDNRLSYCNDYLSGITGLGRETFSDSSWPVAIHPDDSKRVRQAWDAAVDARKQFHTECRLLHQDGTVRRIEVVADPIERDGDYLGYVGVLEDVTERIEAGEKLVESNDQLRLAMEQLQLAQAQALKQERLNALGQMAAGVAHDINNSLTPLITYAELLERESGLSADGQEYARLVQIGVRDTAETVRRLDHFYRGSHNRYELEQIDLAELVQQTIELTRPRWQDQAQVSRRQISVTSEISDAPMVRADTSRLRAVLTNLIFNSVEAISGDGQISIHVRRVHDTTAVVEITDSGKGMTPDELKCCTDPFFTSKSHGSGLGLSECHGIIRSHDGSLTIQSEENVGTTIRIELPCEAKESATKTCEAVSVAGRMQPKFTSDDHGDRIRILYIDDNEAAVMSTTLLLSSMNIEVDAAIDGPAGLEKLQDESYHLVLCDQGLPGMDGVAVLNKIKRRLPDLPVVMVSGWALPEIVDGPQPDGFLQKPYSGDALQELLSRLLSENVVRSAC